MSFYYVNRILKSVSGICLFSLIFRPATFPLPLSLFEPIFPLVVVFCFVFWHLHLEHRVVTFFWTSTRGRGINNFYPSPTDWKKNFMMNLSFFLMLRRFGWHLSTGLSWRECLIFSDLLSLKKVKCKEVLRNVLFLCIIWITN